MLKKVNKKAQGLSTNAIILIILGVVVLAILVIGFTLGWDKIAPWISSSESNVDTIVQQCNLACSTNSVNDYCIQKRTLNDGVNEIIGTCAAFATGGYGVEDCLTLCSATECGQIKGVLVAPKSKDPYICPDLGYGSNLVEGTYQKGIEESPDGKICCKY